MKKVFVLFLIMLSIYSCKTNKEINDGSLAYKLKKYELAKSLLNKEIPTAKSTEKLLKIIELAESYRFSNDPKNALKWYNNALENGATTNILFDIAMMQKQTEDYDAAIKTLERYKATSYDELRTIPEISICKKAKEALTKPNNMTVENYEKINTSSSDFSVIAFKNNNLVISSSRSKAKGENIHPWNGEKNSDLFLVDRKTNKLSSLDSLLNSELPEANITFNKNFSIAYFTRCGFSKDVNQNGYCHIYKTEKDGDGWYEPEKVRLFDDTINVGQPFLTQDGKRLYFSSDAPVGYGGRDIYFANIDNNEIGFAINAGYTINTKDDELFPTTDSKGNLYFSSNGRTGFGGLDIFKAEPIKRGFDVSKQMPYPINSGADDFALVYTKEFDGKETNGLIEEGFFVSTRKGGKGGDDIYTYKKELFNTFKLELHVMAKSFEDPEDDTSKFLGMISLDSAEIIFIKNLTKEKVVEMTDKNGNAFFPLEVETDYSLLIAKKDYFNKSIAVSTKNYKDLTKVEIILKDTVELEKIFPQKEIVIDNIYYDLDKANLRPESLPVLDKLVSFFNENNDLTIEIGSHTDSRGSDDYNQDLSQRRAQSVVNYFVEKGIPKTQLIPKGYGETKILNNCTNDIECTEEEHQKNRRTSFRVVSSDGVLESN